MDWQLVLLGQSKMKRIVIIETHVPLCFCPPGDWEPFILRLASGEIVGMSVSPIPLVSRQMLTAEKDGEIDPPGTWRAHPAEGGIWEAPGHRVVAEQERRGEVVVMRLVRVPCETGVEESVA